MSTELMKMQVDGLGDLIAKMDERRVAIGMKRGHQIIGDDVANISTGLIIANYNIKARDVKDTFDVYAESSNVIVSCTGRPINLTYFGATQYGSRGGKRFKTTRVGDSIESKAMENDAEAMGGVIVQIRLGQYTKLPHAFIQKVRAGKSGFNIGVFARANHARKSKYINPYSRKTSRPYKKVRRALLAYRQAIVNKKFISVPELFDNSNVKLTIDNYLKEKAPNIIRQEILKSTELL